MAYKLQGKMEFQGLQISIENLKGSKRYWTDEATGETGATEMKYPYGYVKGTLGVDGDAVDVYVGPNKASTKVFVITQNKKPEAGLAGTHPWVETDEQKVMLGFDSAKDAQDAYMDHYDDPRFFGRMIELTVDAFKERLISHKGELIKGLKVLRSAAIMSQDNTMLVLSKATSEKAFKPVALKPGSEDTGVQKGKMVDSQEEEDMDKAEKSLTLADATAVLRKSLYGDTTPDSRPESMVEIHKAQQSLNETTMDLKKKYQSKKHDKLPEDDTPKNEISKALRAIVVSGMTRRQKLDAAYQLGRATGQQNPVAETEPAQIKLDVGVSRVQPDHEPLMVPVRRVQTPPTEQRMHAMHKSCDLHGYVHKSDQPCPLCKAADVGESGPLWRR